MPTPPALLTATHHNTLTLDYIDNQTGMATITINVDDTDCFSTQEIFVVTAVPQMTHLLDKWRYAAVDSGGTAIHNNI